MDASYILVALVVVAVLVIIYYRLYIYAWYIEFPYPVYSFTFEKNVKIPMRDGVNLATDIYYPKTSKKVPAIIMRTPYNKAGKTHPYRLLAHLFASQGYAFLVQDVRGRFMSEGEYDPYQNEGLDGYTTVEWVAKAPWCDGNVALYGFSYLGSCSWLTVPFDSPHLKTIVPMFTTQDIYSIFIEQGIFHLKGSLYWFTNFIGRDDSKRIPFKELKKSFMKLPVSSLDKDAFGKPIKTYQDFVHHIVPDDFWANICVSQRMGEINIPAMIISGWFDPCVQGSIDDYLRMINSRDHSQNKFTKLIIGPWAHNPSQKFYHAAFGRQSDFNLQLKNILVWFNYWLKNDKTALDFDKKICYYLMGRNVWKQANTWPPEGVKYKNYYLSCIDDGSKYVHTLLENPPTTLSTANYVYDPNDPVPFRGSHHLHDSRWIGPFDQSELLCRKDMLTYMTEPLKEDLTVAGVMKLILYVSTDVLDTDFCAKICDVHSGGESHYLQAGFVRMRYRESLHMPVLVQPGKVYCLEISLRSIAHVFLKDHRIQLQIASCDFPVHDRNLNTGESCEFSTEIKIANQTIYSGGQYSSHIVLPILPEDNI